MDITQSAMSRRNVIVRFILTLIYIVIITTLCCMLPFFADFVALCGAIGFTPLVRLSLRQLLAQLRQQRDLCACRRVRGEVRMASSLVA